MNTLDLFDPVRVVGNWGLGTTGFGHPSGIPCTRGYCYMIPGIFISFLLPPMSYNATGSLTVSTSGFVLCTACFAKVFDRIITQWFGIRVGLYDFTGHLEKDGLLNGIVEIFADRNQSVIFQDGQVRLRIRE